MFVCMSVGDGDHGLSRDLEMVEPLLEMMGWVELFG